MAVPSRLPAGAPNQTSNQTSNQGSTQTSTRTPTQTPTRTGAPARLPAPAEPPRLLLRWHLLSLDAPTVAVTWAWAMAEETGLRLPLSALAILGLGTWLVYVADRLLDGWHPREALEERHRFHGRHRRLLLPAAAAAALGLVWLVATRMPAGARRGDSVLFCCAAGYLGATHALGWRRGQDTARHFGVGALFALAAALPAWARLPAHDLRLAPAVLSLAAACWLNLGLIERWENGDRNGEDGRDGARHRILSLLCVLAPVLTSAAQLAAGGAAALPLSALAACALLITLDRLRERVSLSGRRVFADLALLTPLVALPLHRLLGALATHGR